MVSEYKDIDGKLVHVSNDGVPNEKGIELADKIKQLEKERQERLDIFKKINPELLADFKKFHQENPHVYKLFMEYVELLKKAGREKYSAWAIINRIRWDYDISTTGEPFKIKNDFIALYARLAYYHHPELQDFFTMRAMKEYEPPWEP